MINKMNLLQMTQHGLKKYLKKHLRNLGYDPISADGYLYAKGEIPVLLVAHLDTVHKEPPRHFWYAQNGDKWKADEGIGGDDRCGVYCILNVIRDLRCHVLFCEDEELGCIGAERFDLKPAVNYIIEFDRKGHNDAVFYDCDNEDFTEFILQFGFQKEYGSFSDISVIAPKLGVAAVNLSSGYYNAHTKDEYIVWSEVEDTIRRAKEIINADHDAYYAYIPIDDGYKTYSGYGWYDDHYRWHDSIVDDKLVMFFNGALMRGDEYISDVYEDDMIYCIDNKGMVYSEWGEGIYVAEPGYKAVDNMTMREIRFDPDLAMCMPVISDEDDDTETNTLTMCS